MRHHEEEQHEAEQQQAVRGADLFICMRFADLGGIIRGMRSGLGKKENPEGLLRLSKLSKLCEGVHAAAPTVVA